MFFFYNYVDILQSGYLISFQKHFYVYLKGVKKKSTFAINSICVYIEDICKLTCFHNNTTGNNLKNTNWRRNFKTTTEFY